MKEIGFWTKGRDTANGKAGTAVSML